VGSDTVIIDDPELTARPGDELAERQPLRIVVDSRGRIPPMARVLAGPAKTVVATTEAATPTWRAVIEAQGAEVLATTSRDGHVDLRALLEELGRRNILTLFVEGGGVINGGFFDAGLVDKVHAVLAPMIIGAAEAPAAVAGRGAYRMAEALRLSEVTVERLGEDILVTGYPEYRERNR
jgi:diaminohydroxyphosphoribosylaminopyrimidine deaminase/5-amino-6-(5-phosphoribosylamino)uracil reductase